MRRKRARTFGALLSLRGVADNIGARLAGAWRWRGQGNLNAGTMCALRLGLRLRRKRDYFPDVRRTTAQPMKATLKAAISSEASAPTVIRAYAPQGERRYKLSSQPAISVDLDQYEPSNLHLRFLYVLFEPRGRAMPIRTLCPKCHGRGQSSALSAVALAADASLGTSSVSAGSDGSGQCRCDVCGGAAEVEPDTLQRLTSEQGPRRAERSRSP